MNKTGARDDVTTKKSVNAFVWLVFDESNRILGLEPVTAVWLPTSLAMLNVSLALPMPPGSGPDHTVSPAIQGGISAESQAHADR